MPTNNNWAVSLALWVSAFETMANVSGSVGFGTVKNMIEAVPSNERLKRPLAPYDYRSIAARVLRGLLLGDAISELLGGPYT